MVALHRPSGSRAAAASAWRRCMASSRAAARERSTAAASMPARPSMRSNGSIQCRSTKLASGAMATAICSEASLQSEKSIVTSTRRYGPRGDCLTISTGRVDFLTMRSAVEPMTRPRRKPAPSVPVTTTSAFTSSATRASSSTMRPVRTYSAATTP